MKKPTWRTKAQRIIVPIVMTVSVILLSTILVFLMLGYRFNHASGTFEQGGLVQFISQPTGAKVFVGDIQLANLTRSKITLNPGSYLIKMERNGYQTWQKNVTVKAGTVLWLNSAHLVPNQPKTDGVASFQTLGSTSGQNGVARFAVIEKPTEPSISWTRIDSDTIKMTPVTIPSDKFHDGKDQTFTLGDWLNDHTVLVKHMYDGLQEWLIVNVDDMTKTIAVPAHDTVVPVKIFIDPRSSGQLIVLESDGTVVDFNLSTGQQVALPINNIAEMMTDDRTIFYVTKPHDSVVTTGYLTLDKTTARTLGTYPTDQPVHLASAEYFGVRSTITSVGKTVTVTKFTSFPVSDSQDPLQSQTIKTITTPTDVASVIFKGQGRFAVAEEQLAETVYDLELDNDNSIPLAATGQSSVAAPLGWIDDFHFWSDRNGSMRQYEFDGTNQTDIVAVASGFSAVYSPDQKYLYTIGKTITGYQLQRTLMIIN